MMNSRALFHLQLTHLPRNGKKIKIQANDDEVSELVKDMMEMDEPQESPAGNSQSTQPTKKIRIMDEGSDPSPQLPAQGADSAS